MPQFAPEILKSQVTPSDYPYRYVPSADDVEMNSFLSDHEMSYFGIWAAGPSNESCGISILSTINTYYYPITWDLIKKCKWFRNYTIPTNSTMTSFTRKK